MTKNADKLVCIVYKIYLERQKQGLSGSESVEVGTTGDMQKAHFKEWAEIDIGDLCDELKETGYLTKDILGNITLLPKGIEYMEGRFKRKINQLLDYIEKIKP